MHRSALREFTFQHTSNALQCFKSDTHFCWHALASLVCEISLVIISMEEKSVEEIRDKGIEDSN